MTLTKPRLIGLLGLGLVVPLLAGGRDNLALILNFFAVGLVMFLIFRSEERVKLGGWVPVILLLLLGWGTVSLWWSPNRFQTIGWVVNWYLLVGAFVLGQWLRQTGRWETWLRGYLWVASVFSLYGMYLLVTADYNRLTSTFYWANPMAGFLLPAAFVAYFRWNENGRKFDGAMAVIVGSALLLTYSRGGIGSALLVGVVAAAVVRRPARFWIRFVIAAVLALSLSTLIPQLRGLGQPSGSQTAVPAVSQESRFAEAASGESTSIQDRLNYLQSSLRIWQEHPLTGTGAGTWDTVYPGYQTRVISAANNAHNWYVQTAAELGIIGFGLLAAIVALVAWSARGQLKDRQLLPVILGLAALTIHMGVDIDAAYPTILLLFGILVGIVYQSERTNRFILPVVLLVGLMLAWPAVSIYQSQSMYEKARIWQDNHEYQKAAEAFGLAADGLVYDPDALTAQGINHFTLAGQGTERETDASTAHSLAQAAIKQDRLDSQHYFLKARSELLLGQYAEAERSYRQAIDRDRLNHPEYYVDLARLLLFNQRWTEAHAELDRVIALYPKEVLENRHLDESVAPTIETAQALRAQIASQP